MASSKDPSVSQSTLFIASKNTNTIVHVDKSRSEVEAGSKDNPLDLTTGEKEEEEEEEE